MSLLNSYRTLHFSPLTAHTNPSSNLPFSFCCLYSSFVSTNKMHCKGCLFFLFNLDKESRGLKNPKLAWKISNKSLVFITDAAEFLENTSVTEPFGLENFLQSLHSGFPQADETGRASSLGKPRFRTADLAQDTKLVSHTVRPRSSGRSCKLGKGLHRTAPVSESCCSSAKSTEQDCVRND